MRRCTTAFLAGTLTATTLAQQAILKGIEPGDLDRTAQPCNDFYQFANGTWRAQKPHPCLDGSLEPPLAGGRNQ